MGLGVGDVVGMNCKESKNHYGSKKRNPESVYNTEDETGSWRGVGG